MEGEEKYMDEGEVQSARSVYMRFFPRAMELIVCDSDGSEDRQRKSPIGMALSS